MTRTFSILRISKAAHDEIRQRLIDAGAEELIQGGLLHMEDIALESLESEHETRT